MMYHGSATTALAELGSECPEEAVNCMLASSVDRHLRHADFSSQRGNDDRLVSGNRTQPNKEKLSLQTVLDEINDNPGYISRLLNQYFTCIQPDYYKRSLEDCQFITTPESEIKRTSKRTN
jgi:hypothetical protein